MPRGIRTYEATGFAPFRRAQVPDEHKGERTATRRGAGSPGDRCRHTVPRGAAWCCERCTVRPLAATERRDPLARGFADAKAQRRTDPVRDRAGGRGAAPPCWRTSLVRGAPQPTPLIAWTARVALPWTRPSQPGGVTPSHVPAPGARSLRARASVAPGYRRRPGVGAVPLPLARPSPAPMAGDRPGWRRLARRPGHMGAERSARPPHRGQSERQGAPAGDRGAQCPADRWLRGPRQSMGRVPPYVARRHGAAPRP
jgi:hypothetical protein